MKVTLAHSPDSDDAFLDRGHEAGVIPNRVRAEFVEA
jgi:predicted solute-binding protein